MTISSFYFVLIWPSARCARLEPRTGFVIGQSFKLFDNNWSDRFADLQFKFRPRWLSIMDVPCARFGKRQKLSGHVDIKVS